MDPGYNRDFVTGSRPGGQKGDTMDEAKERTAIDQVIEGILEGMRDTRVAGAIRREFLPELRREMIEKLPVALADPEGEDGPDSWDEDSVEAAMAQILEGESEDRATILQAVGAIFGRFIRDHRDRIVVLMRNAGEGPAEDRDERVARGREALAEAERLTGALRVQGSQDPEKVQVEVDAVVEILEPVREDMADLVLDDAILGRGDDAASDVPGSDIGGHLLAVAILRQAWMIEVDALCLAAERVGPPLKEGEVAAYEQRTFLLDAIVALQEAVALRPDPADVLRLAALRQAKGDVGEARALCERLLETDLPDDLRERAESLKDMVSDSSPLGGDRRCFLATAAMGPDAPEVWALRSWRDRALRTSATGRAAIAVYYRLSPPLARLVAARPGLRRAVRTLLVEPLARWVGSPRS
jgi:hypothetical protein